MVPSATSWRNCGFDLALEDRRQRGTLRDQFGLGLLDQLVLVDLEKIQAEQRQQQHAGQHQKNHEAEAWPPFLRARTLDPDGVAQRDASQRPELEADAVDGLDHGLAAGGGHLGADVADVAVDGAVRDMDIAGIGGIEDQLAGEDESRPRQQRPQDREFKRGQRNRRVLRMSRCARRYRSRARHGSWPWFRGGAGALRARRRIALTRATSSRGLNGFVT